MTGPESLSAQDTVLADTRGMLGHVLHSRRLAPAVGLRHVALPPTRFTEACTRAAQDGIEVYRTA
ncbi:hypothetical protein ACVGVM_28175 (plasmid) [Pseudonocardia bannensis]|uniref:Uncharacterized protein n=1 Tax=Pseudonocardia bannensis TaxID=630973 RepID=A0A848DI39_9PSEU|nr:hypothetical protein [Pseudonocardia bannensis]